MESYSAKYFRCRWLAWLTGRGLPLDQAAIVLDISAQDAERYLADHRESGRSDPDAPPGSKYYHPRQGAKTIRAEQASKVRRLRDLGYTARKIGHFLNLDPSIVAEFLERDTPLPYGPRAKTRTRAEQRRVEAVYRRRRQRERRNAKLASTRAAIASWGKLTAPDEPAEPVEVPKRAEVPAALVGADQAGELAAALPAIAPTEARNPWEGPTHFGRAIGSAHGRSKLTEADVMEIRELRAAGWSTGDLATAFGVTRSTVTNILTGKTWTHLGTEAPPPSLDPTDPLPTGRNRHR